MTIDHTIIEDIGLYRHWHRESERYASGEALATALFLGWQIRGIVRAESHWRSGARQVFVFYFDLARGDKTMTMPVIANPFVHNLIAEKALIVKPTVSHAARSRQKAEAVAARAG